MAITFPVCGMMYSNSQRRRSTDCLRRSVHCRFSGSAMPFSKRTAAAKFLKVGDALPPPRRAAAAYQGPLLSIAHCFAEPRTAAPRNALHRRRAHSPLNGALPPASSEIYRFALADAPPRQDLICLIGAQNISADSSHLTDVCLAEASAPPHCGAPRELCRYERGGSHEPPCSWSLCFWKRIAPTRGPRTEETDARRADLHCGPEK